MLDGVKDISVRNGAVIITFDKSIRLPELGTEIKSDNLRVIVTSVDEENNSITALPASSTSLMDLVNQVIEQLEVVREEIAEESYRRFSANKSGLLSLISWELLSKEDKDPYCNFADYVLGLFRDKKILRFGV